MSVTSAVVVAAVVALSREGSWTQPQFRGPSGRARAERLAEIFVAAARETGEDPVLLVAVARNESGFHTSASGGRGEVGLMQVSPATARHFKCGDVRGDRASALCGARVLAAARVRCHSGGDVAALSAYNTGRCWSSHGRTYARRVLGYVARARGHQ